MRISSFPGEVIVIPARYASTRFPGKPLAPICGVPLILRVVERVSAAFSRDQIVVATDDERIQRVCEEKGIRVVMTRPACLTGTDRVWEAVSAGDAATIVNVQGDEPLIRTDDVMAVLEAKRSNPGFVINAMCRIRESDDIKNPNVPKVVVNDKNELMYISRAPIPYLRNASAAGTGIYYRQVCIYGFDRTELQAFYAYGQKSKLEEPEDIEILRFLDMGIPVKMVEVSEGSMAVDIPEDVPRVERILKHQT